MSLDVGSLPTMTLADVKRWENRNPFLELKGIASSNIMIIDVSHESCRYFNKYGPLEGAKDRKSVTEFLQQTMIMCSSCR